MPDLLAQLKAALADRYTVQRELGRGGMARVFLAEERHPQRHVAIKVLDPDLGSILGPERFLREVDLAAKLTHPHILPIHAAGEADGLLYYVMPYVEGESLRDRLNRERQLPLDDALQIAREVADALSYAHSRDVVHRDIKPENILLESGHAVVADFGIARAISAAGGEKLTQTGVSIGTPAYMSPEQAAGSQELDGRSDLYSLGCVLFEMLAGQPPFTDPMVARVIHQHLTAEAPSITTVRPAVPASVAGVLARALSKTPADRFSPAAQFAEALRVAPAAAIAPASVAPPLADDTPRPARLLARRSAVVVAAAVAVLAVAAGVVVLAPTAPSSLVGDRVVVGLFENQTGDATLDVIGSMAVDWITQGLQQTGLVDVIPSATARQASQYVQTEIGPGGAGDPVRALAMETGAGKVISGSYYRQGDSVRVQVQVTDAVRGELLGVLDPVSAAANAPEPAIDLLRRQVTGLLATLVNPRLRAYAEAARRPPNYEAYQEWTEGLEAFIRGEYAAAIPRFRRAFELDSTFLLPLTQARSAYFNLGMPAESDSVLRMVEERAGYLTPYDAYEVEAARAHQDGSNMGWLLAFRRRAELAPGSARDWYGVAYGANRVNRPREAIEALSGLDPERGWLRGWSAYWNVLSSAYHMLGEHAQELKAARRGRAQYPNSMPGLLNELRALAALGRTAEIEPRLGSLPRLSATGTLSSGWVMVATARELRAHGQAAFANGVSEKAIAWYRATPSGEPSVQRARHRLGEALMDAGQWDEARMLFEGLTQEFPDSVDYLGNLAIASARLGDEGRARQLGGALAAGTQPFLYGKHPLWRARIAAVLGERERAVTLLAEAIAQGLAQETVQGVWTLEGWLHADPRLESLRGYPPFEELLRPKG